MAGHQLATATTPAPVRVIVAGSTDVRCEALAATLAAAGLCVAGPVPPDDRSLDAAAAAGPPAVVVIDASAGALAVRRLLDTVARRWPAARPVVVGAGDEAVVAEAAAARALLVSSDHQVDDFVAAVAGGAPRRLAAAPATASGAAAAPDPGDLPAGLTPREVEVLQLLATGKRNDDVAAALNISPHTVRSHLQSIHSKLGVQSRLAAVARARRVGVLPGPEASR